MASYFFAQPVHVEIQLEGWGEPKTKLEEDRREADPVYYMESR